MNQRELNLRLLENFPILESAYREETEWQESDDTGSHVVYGDVFAPYIIEKIKQNDMKELANCFRFIEKLLEENDSYIENVISCSVIESIVVCVDGNPHILELLGNRTAKIYCSMGRPS